MLNPDLLKFMMKNNLEETSVEEKQEDIKLTKTENKMSAYSKFAAIPIEIRK